MYTDRFEPIYIEDLSSEEFRFVKAQQSIDQFCREIQAESTLKSQVETVKTVDSFIEIAAENGYEFTLSDLQAAINWAIEETQDNADELEDYELSEEELEMVAGGTARRGAVYNNSYWHSTGVIVDSQCFYSDHQSLDVRSFLANAIKDWEKWTPLGNGQFLASDTDGNYSNTGLASSVVSGMVYDGAYNMSNLGQLNSSLLELI